MNYANVVLLDATGWDQFPVLHFTEQFNDNPCHYIDARFIVLVTRSCYVYDRYAIVQFLNKQGIVNYAIIPMPFSAYGRVNNMYVFTQNRFSKEGIYVKLGSLNYMHHLFPNKLTDLYGYHIRIGVKQEEFPYVSLSKDPDEISGILNIMFRELGERMLNLSYTIFLQKTERYDADAYYDIVFQREHFQHDFAFRDMGGMCLFCPEKYTKNFFSHQPLPFALSGWLFMGGVLIACWLLRLRFATIFRYDPVLQMLFGVIGSDYNQTFPARAILFALSCLSFFFSRTYISRIVALMSLRTFHKRPKTIAEFIQSDHMMVLHKQDLLRYALDDFLPKMLPLEEFNELRGLTGIQYHYLYCSLEPCGEARWLTSPANHGYEHEFFNIEESIVPYPHRLQFAKNSPIGAVMHRYIGLFYETGLWDYYFKGYIDQLRAKSEPKPTILEVVFSFDDLTSLWILLGGGLLISTSIFILELLGKKRT